MKAFWQGLNKDNAPAAIVSNTKLDYQHLHEYPQQDVLDFIPNDYSVLDFACGIGRNSYSLLKKFKKVTCYDLPNMIQIMKETDVYKEYGSLLPVYDSWEAVRGQQFDAIFCCLALQHIYEPELMQYLEDFRTMTNNLYVFTRSYNDDNKKLMLPMLLRKFDYVSAMGYTLEEITAMREEDHYMIRLERK